MTTTRRADRPDAARPGTAHAIALAPTRSKFAASRTALWALIVRDLVVLRKHIGEFVIRTLIQPFLLVFVFLYVFPTIGQGVGGGTRAPHRVHVRDRARAGRGRHLDHVPGDPGGRAADVHRVRLHPRDRGPSPGAVPDLAGGHRQGAVREPFRGCSPP